MVENGVTETRRLMTVVVSVSLLAAACGGSSSSKPKDAGPGADAASEAGAGHAGGADAGGAGGGDASAGGANGGAGGASDGGADTSVSDASDAADTNADIVMDGPVTCSAQTSWEPNDTPAQACAIALQTVVESTIVGAAPDADDYYAVPVTSGKIYAFQIWNTTPIGSNVSIDIQLTGGGLTLPLLASTPIPPLTAASNAGYWDLKAAASGTAIVHVRSTASATYKLVVRPSTADGLTHDPTTYEPNDTLSTAAPVTFGTAVATSLTAQDYFDDYSFPVTKDHSYAFTFTLPSGICQPLVGTLRNDGGDMTLFPSTNYGPSCIYPGGSGGAFVSFGEFKAPDTGTAILAIQNTAVYSYQLVVYQSTADGLVHDASFEPNNTPGEAAPLTLGTAIAASINVSDDYIDYYQVAVTGGTKYVVTASDTGTRGGFGLSGSVAGVAAFANAGVGFDYFQSPTQQITFTPAASGTLLLAISNADMPTTYTLEVAVSP